jgi:hypothetical protein
MVSAAAACLAGILLLLLGSSKRARLTFNSVMLVLSGTLGSLGQWTILNIGSAAAYGLSVMADGFLVDADEVSGEKSTSFFGSWTFSFITRYISSSQRRIPTVDDIPGLPESFSPEKAQLLLEENYQVDGSTYLPSFFRLLYLECRTEMALCFVFEITNTFCKLAEPWALQAFLMRKSPGVICVMLLLAVVHAVTTTQGIYQRRCAGAKMKATLGSNVFEKASRAGRSGRRQAAEMSAVNLVEIDVMRIQDFMLMIHVFVFLPIQIGSALISLGKLLGWQSGLAAGGSVVRRISPLHAWGEVLMFETVAYNLFRFLWFRATGSVRTSCRNSSSEA